jgi:hypothetical protein
LAEFKNHHGAIRSYNSRVYALSADTPEQSRAFQYETELPFELLCDIDKTVINLYDLLNLYEHGGIAYPAVFVIKPDGDIAYRSIDGTARRVDISHVLHFLENLHEQNDFQPETPPPKQWILPSFKNLSQIYRNMRFRGNAADWKHYILYPVNTALIPVRKMMRRIRRAKAD